MVQARPRGDYYGSAKVSFQLLFLLGQTLMRHGTWVGGSCFIDFALLCMARLSFVSFGDLFPTIMAFTLDIFSDLVLFHHYILLIPCGGLPPFLFIPALCRLIFGPFCVLIGIILLFLFSSF